MRNPAKRSATWANAVPVGKLHEPGRGIAALWQAYSNRMRRRRLLFRAFRHRHDLALVVDRTAQIKAEDILCFVCLRNEARRLPGFLAHNRRLGVRHFLVVDNGSDDGSADLLAQGSDISVWRTEASYKAARFGMDWLTWLMSCHGSGHWCLTLDADEILVYPYCDRRPLSALTGWLDQQGRDSFGALTLDMYPDGPVSSEKLEFADDPISSLRWFDSGNYQMQVQPRMRNLWIQGGARARAFFADSPRKAPTLNKTPLVRWHWRYAYVNSTHALLPSRLNEVYATDGGELTSGVLLHTKFLPEIIERSREEKLRGQHFADGEQYAAYYDRLTGDPVLHCATSTRYTGWRQLVALGLMSRGGWI